MILECLREKRSSKNQTLTLFSSFKASKLIETSKTEFAFKLEYFRPLKYYFT